MRMTISPWPEVAEALHERLGYVGGQDYEMNGEALHSIVEAGFDIMVRNHPGGRNHVGNRQEATIPSVQVSPGGRGFGQR